MPFLFGLQHQYPVRYQGQCLLTISMQKVKAVSGIRTVERVHRLDLARSLGKR
ncbi:hypothetical protein O9929_12620 [Vibrio lentus]|nr:hypothetical protein [Vibrio lentus]